MNKDYAHSMQDDTISRQAAIDAIRASTSKYTGFMEMEMYTDDDAVEAIEALPSAQKEGEWIEVHDWLQIPQEESGTYRCSACGQVMKYPWNYCPNCGARMKGEQE